MYPPCFLCISLLAKIYISRSVSFDILPSLTGLIELQRQGGFFLYERNFHSSSPQVEIKCNNSKLLSVGMSDLSYCTSLTCLDLGSNGLDVDGFQLIANVPFVNLTNLSLYRNEGGDEGIRYIANSPNMKNLTILDVSFNYATRHGIISMADSEHMSNLTWLNTLEFGFGRTHWFGSGIRYTFQASPFMKNLSGFLENETGMRWCPTEAIMIYFLKQNPSWHYGDIIPSALRIDKVFAASVISICGNLLGAMSVELQNDKSLVLLAINNDADSLKFASDDLKNDVEVVMTAVRKNGLTLQYASEALRNDRQVVGAAVSEDEYSLKFASTALKNDKEILSMLK